MATVEAETLFSLELAVKSLCIAPHTVICRMPAVAFRLLDFPSLLVQQLDETETKHLKEAIEKTWSDDDIPNQLQELKDRHGNYEFDKGKSMLFKYKLNSLASHLQNTPLYVMVVDSWTAVPKLIAHCNISLSDVINTIVRDVSDLGISVPSVHGMQGKFPVFNLMGSEIGWMSLGIRLLSLGGNLIPHIPNISLTKKELAVSENLPVIESDEMRSRPEVQQKLVPMSTPEPQASPNQSKTSGSSKRAQSVTNVEDIACQTTDNKENVSSDKEGRTRHDLRDVIVKAAGEELEQELFITNTHMPPPLIFTSENEKCGRVKNSKQKKDNWQLYAIQDKTRTILNERNFCEASPGESSSRSSVNKDLEVQYIIHPPEYRSSPNVRKILRSKKKAKPKDQLEMIDHTKVADEGIKQIQNATPQNDDEVVFREMEQYHRLPILRALLQELSLLSGSQLDSSEPRSHLRRDLFQQTSNEDRRKESKKENVKSENYIRPQVMELPSRISSIKPPERKPYRHKHRDCAKPPSGVPASKSWLRQHPMYHSKQQQKQTKTKLKFKMTNSQKLRLQRHNPEAYRLLEEEERLAEIEFQMRAAAQMQQELERQKSVSDQRSESKSRSEAGQGSTEHLMFRLDANVSAETSRQHNQEEVASAVQDDGNGFLRGLETYKIPAAEPDDEEGEFQEPVSPDQKKVSPDILSDMSGSDNKSAQQINLHKDTSGSEKSVLSINVHMPSTSGQNDNEDNDDYSSDESEEGLKVVQVPGFPRSKGETQEGLEAVAPSPGIGYSDDFEGSYKFESTGEQELASIQSSKGSGMFPVESSTDVRPVSSREHSDSDQSEGSYRTAESVKSAGSHRAGESIRPSMAQSKSSSSSTSSRHPASVLSIPQPQMSANSPIPLARRSTARSGTFHQPPPQPKPRLSLDQVASSISNTSLLAPDLTLSKSRETLHESVQLKQDSSEDYEQNDGYSDDFDSEDN